jgi:hypothetical protein
VNTKAQRPYRAIVWIDDQPGQRVEVLARTAQEAEQLLRQQFGDQAKLSVWNEEDSKEAR